MPQISRKIVDAELTPSKIREKKYNEKKCVEWEDNLLTIDEANLICLYYIAEGTDEALGKVDSIRPIIAEQKEIIRLENPNVV